MKLPKLRPERLARARQLLEDIKHVSVSTVNSDGTPHCSPVFMVFDNQLNGYWASSVEARHSDNVARDSNVFLVLFDAYKGCGLYIQAKASPLEDDKQIEAALRIMRRQKNTMGSIGHYAGSAPQRIYKAVPTQLSVNQSDRDEQGVVVADYRIPVSPQDLKR